MLFEHHIETFRVVVGAYESNEVLHFQAALYFIKAIEKPVFLLIGQPISEDTRGPSRPFAVQFLQREIEKRIHAKMNEETIQRASLPTPRPSLLPPRTFPTKQSPGQTIGAV